MRAAVYLRQSEDRDGNQLAIDRQRDDCHRLCRDRGWIPVDYTDNDTSAVGPKRKRPAWDQMLTDIEAGVIQALVCWDLDRLYREPSDLEKLIPLADQMRIPMATVTGDVDLSTDNGRLFARIKGAVAKAETERRSTRQKRKYLQLAEAGDPWSSKRPFGYQRDGELVPEEAAVLREAYQMVLSGQTNLSSICRDWDARGITTTGGGMWTHPTLLRGILVNPRYAGLRTYHGDIIGEGKWEPVVERDVWQAVVDILTSPERRAGHGGGRKYLLSGIALCGYCVAQGGPRTIGSGSGDPARPQYRCRACFKVMRQQQRTDGHVQDLIVARLSMPDAAGLLVNQRRPDLEALRTEAATLRARMESLTEDFVDGLLSREQLRVGVERAKSRLSRIEAEMADSAKSHLFQGIIGEDAPMFLSCSLDRRRAVLDALMKVTLLPAAKRGVWSADDIRIDWRSD